MIIKFRILQTLLQLAHDIFEEQTSLTSIMNKTMRRAINLFSCKECKVFLIADFKHTTLQSDEVRGNNAILVELNTN